MSQAPFIREISENVPAVGTAATDSTDLADAPFAGTVTGVTFTPDAAITGANTNTRLVELVNGGQAGAGTTVVASLQFNSGVNAVQHDEKVITLSGTPANLVVAEGDVLFWRSTAVGTGLADPGGLVEVTISRSG